MSAPIMKIGIIGCGVISSAYLKGAARSSLIVVKGIADLNPEAARAQAEAFGVAAVSVDDLLADPEIELVVNLTVPNAHAAVSRTILEADKHVYSEKPLCASAQEARGLLSLAKARDLRIGCAPDTFLGAAHQASRSLVDCGAIGNVLSGSLCVQSRGMESWHPNPDFFFRPGGGPVLDLGPYYLTQLVNLLGPVESVMATAGTGYKTRTIGSGPRAGEAIAVETPTSYSALLTLRSGARIALEASWDVWKHQRVPIELYGTEGTLLVPDPNFFGDSPRVSLRDGDWQTVDISRYAYGTPNRTLRTGREVADHRSIGVVDMVTAIATGRPHRASAELALHVLDVLEAIDLAARERRLVEVGSTCERPLPLPQGSNEAVFAADAFPTKAARDAESGKSVKRWRM